MIVHLYVRAFSFYEGKKKKIIFKMLCGDNLNLEGCEIPKWREKNTYALNPNRVTCEDCLNHPYFMLLEIKNTNLDGREKTDKG